MKKLTKTDRQAVILKVISENVVDRQTTLLKLLTKEGVDTTQATLSRDMRELKVERVTGEDGICRYRHSPSIKYGDERRTFSSILSQAALDVKSANNLVVVKTITGMGSAAGASVDSMLLDGVVGTLAGDDTLLIITSDGDSAERIAAKIKKMMG